MSSLQDRIAQFRKMASDDPDNELGHFRLGQLLSEAGDHAEAVKSFEHTLELSPGFSKVFQLLGQSLLKLGKKAEAIDVWTRGWKVADERGDKMPRDDMARLLRENGAPVPEATRAEVDEGPETGFKCNRPGCLAGKRARQLPAPPLPDELHKRIYREICARLLERLAAELQCESHQRAAARPEQRVRPGRVRQVHARVLRIRVPAEAMIATSEAPDGRLPRDLRARGVPRPLSVRDRPPARRPRRDPHGPRRRAGHGAGRGESRVPGPDLGGDVLRVVTADDESAAAALATRAAGIAADAQALAESLGLPLLFLDGEILLDGGPAILQAVHWADCDATPLFEQLSARHGLRVQLADLTAAPKAPARVCDTCGEEKSGCSDCGSGGGCSTGSCSKGSVKSAEELTAYFAGLRRQMEAAAPRVSLH